MRDTVSHRRVHQAKAQYSTAIAPVPRPGVRTSDNHEWDTRQHPVGFKDAGHLAISLLDLHRLSAPCSLLMLQFLSYRLLPPWPFLFMRPSEKPVGYDLPAVFPMTVGQYAHNLGFSLLKGFDRNPVS